MRLLFFLLIALPSLLVAQDVPTLHIKKAVDAISIDGKLLEQSWKLADKAGNFWQSFPYDTSHALTRTEVMVTFDQKNLYVAAVCFDAFPQKDFVVQSLKRDFSYPVSDAFGIVIDPFQDHTNGFAFGVNPYGAQREGLVANGGFFGVTTDWDNIWYSEVHHDSDRWTVEMSIPFTSIRFKDNLKTWGINFTRNDLKRNESSTWGKVPRTFNIATLNYCGHLIWDEAPPEPRRNISLIPYATARFNQDYRATDKSMHAQPNAGLDAKIGLTASLNLDLTVNPDFSQVEVDRQLVNLTRFSLAYPEKRLFFSENSDLFAQFGFSQIRPFFSRRIGLYQSPKDLQLKNIPILAGARLSGRINKNWRIGAMQVQTVGDKSLQINAQNYTVLALQRQVFKTSNLAFIALNRRQTTAAFSEATYNRILGADFNLLSPNNKWRGKAFFHQSFSPLVHNWKSAWAHAVWLSYTAPTFYWNYNHEWVEKNYLAEEGFVPRQQLYDAVSRRNLRMRYIRFEPEIGYRYFVKHSRWKKRINFLRAELYNDTYLDSSGKLSDLLLQPNFSVNFQNSAVLNVDVSRYYTRLLFPSFVAGSSLPYLPVASYVYWQYHVGFDSNRRTKLTYSLNTTLGGFYNGRRYSGSAEVNYRMQPYGIFTLSVSRDVLTLTAPASRSVIWLIGPRAELAFTRTMYLTTFLQYNTQAQNMNVNIRYQWRFRPMCDAFVVYTDNYDPMLRIKNRGLALKLIYWFNS